MTQAIYLSVEHLLHIHRRVIEAGGGDPGLRDRGLLESAVAMPAARFGGTDLHPALPQKAAAYHHHLCSHQPFQDGNKRVAVAAAELFLLLNGLELEADDQALEDLTSGVAEGLITKAEVVEFFTWYSF